MLQELMPQSKLQACSVMILLTDIDCLLQECLKNSSAEDRQAILGSFLASFSADPSGSTLCMVLRDSYGNYVAQRLLEVCCMVLIDCVESFVLPAYGQQQAGQQLMRHSLSNVQQLTAHVPEH